MKESLAGWFARIGDSSRTITIVVGAAGALALALPSFIGLTQPWNIVGLVVASVLIFVAAVLDAAQFRYRDDQLAIAESDKQAAVNLAEEARADNLVLVHDALDQFIQILAKMATATPEEAKSLKSAANVHAVVAALKLADGAREGRHRSVLYVYNPDVNALQVVTKEGRGVQPRDFDNSTPRGRMALEMVQKDGDLYESDVRGRSASKWRTGDESYRSFFSTTVSAGHSNFGMLTVDSQEKDDFDASTREAIRMLGNLLGALYAIEADKSANG